MTRLIGFEENEARSAIDHRLVTEQNLQTKNATDSRAALPQGETR